MLHLHQITHKLHLAQIPNLRSRIIGKEVINKIHPKIELKQNTKKEGQGNTIDYFVKHILWIYPDSMASSHV
jgi:hypothetical protein